MTSKMQANTKFELLANEIFIECFEYLNALDIFYSFCRLNYRFDKLIQNIPLRLSFEHVRKTTFDQFCTIMLSNSEMKRQVCSLRLSNNDTCGQIEAFLSLFTLDEFHSLRSLTLTGVGKRNLEKLKPMLSLLPKLCFLHLIDPDDELKHELTVERIVIFPTIPETVVYHLFLKLHKSHI
jgi:hypothetical protein